MTYLVEWKDVDFEPTSYSDIQVRENLSNMAIDFLEKRIEFVRGLNGNIPDVVVNAIQIGNPIEITCKFFFI